MNRGQLPIAEKARTGLFTSPGIYRFASSKSCAERVNQPSLPSSKKTGQFPGKIGQIHIASARKAEAAISQTSLASSIAPAWAAHFTMVYSPLTL